MSSFVAPSALMVQPNDPNQLNLKEYDIDLLNAAIESHARPKSPKPNSKTSRSNNPKRNIDTSSEEGEEPSAATAKRPGRKPLEKVAISELDPKQKRKAQNRAAQRAFRERKEKHVSELQERIRELEDINAKKDEELIAKKAELEKLQQENYALKDAKFTFEFPIVPDDKNFSLDLASTMAAVAPAGSSISSGNSYSGEDFSGTSSSEHSPHSNTHDELSSSNTNTPTSTDAMHQTDLFNFTPIPSSNDMYFPAIQATTDTTYATGDLFQGKDDLFTSYRVPDMDDFLAPGDVLPALFGSDLDLFGLTAPAPLDGQMNIPLATSNTQPLNASEMCAKIKQAKAEGKNAYEIKQSLQECPEFTFDLDLLCADMKKKVSCSESNYFFTDQDVDALEYCFNKSAGHEAK